MDNRGGAPGVAAADGARPAPPVEDPNAEPMAHGAEEPVVEAAAAVHRVSWLAQWLHIFCFATFLFSFCFLRTILSYLLPHGFLKGPSVGERN